MSAKGTKKSLTNKSSSDSLKNRVIYTILVLVLYRIGTYIPLPNINPAALTSLIDSNSGGILDIFNVFSGGALGRMSIFALNIMPYITASIIIQLMTVASSHLEELKKQGEHGRKTITQYTRYFTVILALIQGYGISVGLESVSGGSVAVVNDPGLFFRITSTVSLVSGTVFLMWLGEQITSRGIGNGISLLIFAGIIAEFPSAIGSIFELSRTGGISTNALLLILFFIAAVIFTIVFIEGSQRKILVQYPKRQHGNKVYAGDNSHIPLKINTAGVIPPIFASSILLFPTTIVNFNDGASSLPEWLESIVRNLSHGQPLYIFLYSSIIIFFCFFYTSIVFNSEETANNLKKNGGFVPGRRPGKSTAEYFDYVLTRLTAFGSVYLVLICVLPEILISKYSIPLYLGGTSLLIIVNVIVDTMTQIQSHLFAQKYENLIKKTRLKGRRR